MNDPGAIDLFRGKHREYLDSITTTWVSYRKKSDRLSIMLRCETRLPPTWLQTLSIELFHDTYLAQETAKDIEWVDRRGSYLTVNCARPKTLIPDHLLSIIGSEVLPIGDVILYTPNHAYEHPLYNQSSLKLVSQLVFDGSRDEERL